MRAPAYDPHDPATRADPYPVYARLRAEAPLHRSETLDAWLVTRHADALSVLSGQEWGNDHSHATTRRSQLRRAAVESGAAPDLMGTVLLFMDPPDHTRVRSLITAAFTPRRVARLRGWVEDLVESLLDEVAAAEGPVDLMEHLAFPLPVAVIAELLGVPAADRGWFREHARHVAPLLDPAIAPKDLAAATAGIGAFIEYFDRLAGRRREDPADDLVSALVHAQVDEHQLDQVELLSVCVLLLIAGHETTMNLIGNGTLALLQHRDQLELLGREGSLGGSAVEELLRYDSPVQLTARTALRDAVVDDQVIRAGDQAIVLLGAGNRDPERFTAPDDLDLRREDNRHLSFSHGAHFCLGAALARLEGAIALPALARRFPGLELAVDAVAWRATTTLRGVTSLPVSTG